MKLHSKRLIALVMAVLLLPALLAGCAKENTETSTETPPATESGDIVYPYDGVYAAYSPDTPMISVGDHVVTWEEFFFYLCVNVEGIITNAGEITDWTSSMEAGMSYAEAAKMYAEQDAISYKILEYGAQQLGVQLSSEDNATLHEQYEASVETYGGEEGFIDYLKQNFCYSEDLYNNFMRMNSLATLCFEAVYGENAMNISDEEVASYTAHDEYLMAKHILFLTQNEDGTEMTDAEKADALANTEEVIEMLDAYEGDDFDTYFDELMAEYSEDPGSAAYPGGYLFQNGDMVTEFYESCLSLDIGAYSKPVQTSYGYHIIYRVPVSYDAVPTAYSGQGDIYTLRYLTAIGMFESVTHGWQDSAEITYSDEFNSLDVAKLFG